MKLLHRTNLPTEVGPAISADAGAHHDTQVGVQRSDCRDAKVNPGIVTAYREPLDPSTLSAPAATAIAMRFAEFTRAT